MFYWVQFAKKRSLWAMPKIENNFFFQKKLKQIMNFQKNFCYQNIICFDLVMNLFVSWWVLFFVKKVSFPAKTADPLYSNLLVANYHSIVSYYWLLSSFIICYYFCTTSVWPIPVYYSTSYTGYFLLLVCFYS